MIIKLQNLEKIIKKYDKLSQVDVMPEITKAARVVQKTAKSLAPVDTGTLKGSIRVKSYKDQKSAIVYTLTEYAIFQEFGTSKMKPQPFMRPALIINRLAIENSMIKFINSQLNSPRKETISDSDDTDEKTVTKTKTRMNGGYRISTGGKVTKGNFYETTKKPK